MSTKNDGKTYLRHLESNPECKIVRRWLDPGKKHTMQYTNYCEKHQVEVCKDGIVWGEHGIYYERI